MPETTPVPVRTYEIETSRGAFRVDLPETWKVTYGPVVGSDKTSVGRTMAFRAWESDNKQRLLISDVIAFRDISIPMKRRAVRKYGSEEWREDDGSWTGKRAEQVQKSWVDMDQLTDLPDEDDKPPF